MALDDTGAIGSRDQPEHKLARLVELRLDVAHLERGTLSMVQHHVDLGQLVEAVMPRTRTTSESWRLPETLHMAYVDELRFEHVLTNLLDNNSQVES